MPITAPLSFTAGRGLLPSVVVALLAVVAMASTATADTEVSPFAPLSGAVLSVPARPDRTPTEAKISSPLLQLVDERFLPPATTRAEHAATMEQAARFEPARSEPTIAAQIDEGRIYCYISLADHAATSAVDPLVMQVTDRDEANHLAVAWVKVKDLRTLAASDAVRSIKQVTPPATRTGSVNTQGDAVHQTDDVRSTYGENGTGINVGIISDGVSNRDEAQATGDLPADGAGLTVLSNAVGGDEGTAMLEIVHDLVPGAGLYFHDCGNNAVQFNSAISDLVSAGCDVVCDDIGWLQEPFFEDGTVASHLTTVLASNNIVYVSAAGNDGQSHYQGDYYPIPSSTQHDFSGDGTDYYVYANLAANGIIYVVFQWNDQFGSAVNDYDLYLYSYATSAVVANSVNDQSGGYPDPYEDLQYQATGATAGDFAIIVDLYSGAAKTLELFLYFGGSAGNYSNNITPVNSIFGHPAVTNAVTAGAVNYSTPSTIEAFSSQGPVTISFGSKAERDKPDVVGCDMVSVTGAGGFPTTFGGTSAAAPHIAGIVAQLWGSVPSWTATQVRNMMKSSSAAVDCGTAGYDHVFGWGRSDAWLAYNNYVPVELSSFSAEAIAGAVVLRWTTLSEIDNLGFNVYRAAGDDGAKILLNHELIPGVGTTMEPRDYSFVDDGIAVGDTYHYWLEQVDVQGAATLYGPLTVSVPSTLPVAMGLEVAPNPVRDEATVWLELPSSAAVTVAAFDLGGRMVSPLWSGQSDAGSLSIPWTTATLPAGTYLVRATAGQNVLVRRVVVH
ncbi:S8 family serine peptidase [Candidatus Fermentibacteria bacterium]|nr:S8 family serine peptidase [Candidatus Fermentibacteria bacterium]